MDHDNGVRPLRGPVASTATLCGRCRFVPGLWLDSAVGMKRRRLSRSTRPFISGLATFRLTVVVSSFVDATAAVRSYPLVGYR